MPVKRSRAFCFTLNNPSESDGEHAVALQNACEYLVFGREKGAEGTEHLQGYVYFKTTKSMAQVSTLLPRAYLAHAKGSPQENYNYCTKDGDFFVHGTMPQQGKRSDLATVCEVAKTQGIKRCAEDFPDTYCKYARGLQQYRAIITPPRTEMPEVFYYYGPTGVGKSYRAFQEAGPDCYFKPKGEWWDGYDGQEHVILDDFYGDISYHLLLNILDRYPLRVPFKGGFHQFVAKKIWITSNKAPEDLYDKVKCPFPPLERRLTHTLFLSTSTQDPEGGGLLPP